MTAKKIIEKMEKKGWDENSSTFYKFQDGTIQAIDKFYGTVYITLKESDFKKLGYTYVDVRSLYQDEKRALIQLLTKYKSVI